MKIPVFLVAIAIFSAKVHGKDVKDLIDSLERSMTKANDYGNNFVGPLRQKLNSEYSMAKVVLDHAINRNYDMLLMDVKLAAKNHGVNASSCVQGLKKKLEGIVNIELVRFEYCMNHTMDFALKFAPFLQNQGNTGYVMIQGLQIVTKNYAALPISQADKCYEGLNWYASAVSHNYGTTTDRYLDIGKTLHTYLVQSVQNCFKTPLILIREKMGLFQGRVTKCIADKINNKP